MIFPDPSRMFFRICCAHAQSLKIPGKLLWRPLPQSVVYEGIHGAQELGYEFYANLFVAKFSAQVFIKFFADMTSYWGDSIEVIQNSL